MRKYDFEIESILARHGLAPSKGVKRTCGNCVSYDDRLMMCSHAGKWDDASINKPNESCCRLHRTNAEQAMLASKEA